MFQFSAILQEIRPSIQNRPYQRGNNPYPDEHLSVAKIPHCYYTVDIGGNYAWKMDHQEEKPHPKKN
jgi:hypothetical protein